MTYENDMTEIADLRNRRTLIDREIAEKIRPYQIVNEQFSKEANRPMYRTYDGVIAEVERGLKALGTVMVNYENPDVNDMEKFRVVNGKIYEYRRINYEYHDRFINTLLNKHLLIATHIKDEKLRENFEKFVRFLTAHVRELNERDGTFSETLEPVVTLPVPRTIYYEWNGNIQKIEGVRQIKCRATYSDCSLVLMNGGVPAHVGFKNAIVDQLAPELTKLFEEREKIRLERTKFVTEIHKTATDLLGDWLVLAAFS